MDCCNALVLEFFHSIVDVFAGFFDRAVLVAGSQGRHRNQQAKHDQKTFHCVSFHYDQVEIDTREKQGAGVRLYLGTAAANEVHDKADDQQHHEDEEQNFSDTGSGTCHTTEAKNGSNDCNNEKDDSPIQHLDIPSLLTRCWSSPSGGAGLRKRGAKSRVI
jgi:hypothetical protein